MNPKLLLIKLLSHICKRYREHTALVSLISACVLCSDRCWTVSAGPLFRSLHWLPVRQRINFKLAKLCYLVTSFQQSGYLADLISPYSQSRLLRSSTQKLLSVPPHNLDTAARRFSVAAPRLWNSLPLNCRTAPSVTHLRPGLRHFSLLRHNPHCVARASVPWRVINVLID